MTPCADSRFIPLLARGELDPAEEARLRSHLATCPTCPGELAAEERLTRALRSDVPRPAAPAGLRASLEEMMRAHRAEPPGRRAEPPGQRAEPLGRRTARSGRRPRRGILAAAAAVVLLAIGGFLALRKPPAADPQSLARHAATAHRTLEGQRDALSSETPEAAARLRELARRYGLPATTAFQGDGELRLVSARQGLALGKVSAVLVYLDAKQRLVTLEILPGGDVTIPAERTRAVRQFHPLLTLAGGLGVALWKQGGATYLLTAPVDEPELAQLFLKVRTHTS